MGLTQGGPSQNSHGEQPSEERGLRLRIRLYFPLLHAVTCGFPLSFVTTTFAMEAMAAANAQLRWKRMEIHKVCALRPPPHSQGGASVQLCTQAVSTGLSSSPSPSFSFSEVATCS